MNTKLQIVKNAISVKNATLVMNDQFYYIVHYDTIIFKQNKETKEISILKPVSDSSTRAILEGLAYIRHEDYVYFDKELLEITEKLNGLTKSELQKVWKHKRYSQPERRTRTEMKDVIESLIGGA